MNNFYVLGNVPDCRGHTTLDADSAFPNFPYSTKELPNLDDQTVKPETSCKRDVQLLEKDYFWLVEIMEGLFEITLKVC